MSATMTTVSGIYKTTYEPDIRYQLNTTVFLASQVAKFKSFADAGNNIVIGVQKGLNPSYASLNDGDVLPTAGNNSYAQLTVPMRHVYLRINVSGPAMRASRNNAGAYARVLVKEKESTIQNARNQYNRELYGDGTGALTTTTGSNTTTSIPVASTKYLTVGQYIDIIDTDGETVNGDGLKITAVDGSALTITVDSAPGTATANGDVIVHKDSSSKAIYGLEALVDNDNTIMSCDRSLSTNEYFRSVLQSATGGLVDEMEMQEVMDDINDKSGKDVDLIITTKAVRRKYAAILVPDKRYSNTIDLKGGFKALDFAGTPLYVDKDCTAGTMYFLVTSVLERHYMSDWEFMSEDGRVLHAVPNYDAYEAVLYCDHQFVTSQGNALGKLYNITE